MHFRYLKWFSLLRRSIYFRERSIEIRYDCSSFFLTKKYKKITLSFTGHTVAVCSFSSLKIDTAEKANIIFPPRIFSFYSSFLGNGVGVGDKPIISLSARRLSLIDGLCSHR